MHSGKLHSLENRHNYSLRTYKLPLHLLGSNCLKSFKCGLYINLLRVNSIIYNSILLNSSEA